MNVSKPPSLATWMMQHLPPSQQNEALAGDLLEQFHRGRSARWYWRQVLAAITLGCFRECLKLRAVLLFAILWSMLAPAWLLIIDNLEQQFDVSGRVWRMDWPWSTVCDLGLLLASSLLFIWVGILLYLIPHLWFARSLNVRQIRRGVLASLPGLVVLWATLIVFPKYFLKGQVVDQPSVAPVTAYSLSHQAQIAIERVSPAELWDVRYGERKIDPYKSPRNAVIDLRKSTFIVRLPFFMTILFALYRQRRFKGNRRIDVVE